MSAYQIPVIYGTTVTAYDAGLRGTFCPHDFEDVKPHPQIQSLCEFCDNGTPLVVRCTYCAFDSCLDCFEAYLRGCDHRLPIPQTDESDESDEETELDDLMFDLELDPIEIDPCPAACILPHRRRGDDATGNRTGLETMNLENVPVIKPMNVVTFDLTKNVVITPGQSPKNRRLIKARRQRDVQRRRLGSHNKPGLIELRNGARLPRQYTSKK